VNSQSISFRKIDSGSEQPGPSRHAHLPVLDEILTPSDPVHRFAVPRRHALRAGDHVDIDLARFADIVDANGWTCNSDSVRAQLDSAICGWSPQQTLPSSRTVGAGQAASQLLAEQVERLTHRAEAAEAEVRAMKARIADERRWASALGRRFGQKPLESFPAFVARLGMTAKALQGTRSA